MRVREIESWPRDRLQYDSAASRPWADPEILMGTGPPENEDAPRWIYLAHELGHHYCGHKIKPTGDDWMERLGELEVEAWEWAIGRQKKEVVRREMLGVARDCLVSYGIENWTPDWAKDGDDGEI